MLRPRLALLLMALAVLTPAAAARASDYSQVLRIYQQRGTIPPCKFSTPQLSAALKGVNLYGAQYFADFTAAIQNALSARAGGSCLTKPVSPASAGAGPSPGANLRLPPGNVTAPTQAGVPAPILLLAGLGAAIGLIAALTGLARLRGWEPAVLPWWRHLWQETGYRAGGVWAEFVDWLRSA
jgi:hypothetical protein